MHNAVTVVWCSLGSPQYKHTVTQVWILYSITYLDYQNDNLLCVQFVPTNSLCGGLPQFFNQNKHYIYTAGENSQTAIPSQRKNGPDQLPIPFCSSVPECCCIDYFSKEAQAGCLKVCVLREHFWIHNPVNVTWTKMVWAVYQTIFPLNRKLFWHKTLGEWLKYSTHSIWWYLWLLCYNIPVLRQLVKCSGVQCL